MKKIILSGLVFILIPAIIGCRQISSSRVPDEYYLSLTGDDLNPGTREKPFKSLQKINTIVLAPGDRIYLNGNDTFQGKLSLTANGSGDQPIIFSSYGNGTAVIDGGNREAIIIRGSHFQLKNINTKGAGRKSGNTSNGITLLEVSNATIEDVKTEGFQKSGLEINACYNVEVKKVYATDNGFCGIYVTGSQAKRSRKILVQDCKADNNPGDPTNLDNHSGNGILAGWSDSVTIDHCTATNNGWDMPRIGNGPVGIWAYESNFVAIQYCISYRNKTAKGAKDGGGFDLDGGVTNSVVQYCLSYENEGAGHGLFQYAGASLWYNNTVRYCLSFNDATTTEGSGGIFLWNNSGDRTQLADCNIYNNLVYSSHAPAVQFERESPNKNFLFSNNIFIGSGAIINGPSSGERFAGNVWWATEGDITFRGYNNLTGWANATGQEKLDGQLVGRQLDPLLAGPFIITLTDPYNLHTLTGYILSPQSSLKNSGLDLQTLFNITSPPHDFFNNPVLRGNKSEPGIYEMED